MRGEGGKPLQFTLDIGTRKVVGLLTEPAPRGLRIVAAERREHRTRSMFDGQVHDVIAVAEVVEAVKARLQQRLGRPLTEVAVAAAGRALRTARGEVCRTRQAQDPIDAGEAFELELEAVQEAQSTLAADPTGAARDYLFMGHSVVERQLDGVSLANLVGQRGETAVVRVVATFLPRSVVESLVAVLDRVSLTMTGLTLEPIAAIEAVIPASMRHLHLALVDVGAGTSDIALTAGGTVFAYDMVPVAGDEFTEALSQTFLLDWNVAEAAKRTLASGRTVSCTDVLGAARTITPAAAAAALDPAVAAWAEAVAARIRAAVDAPPCAVVLVGGGSQAPGAAAALAAQLGLDPDRVALRGRAAIAGVTGGRTLSGPEAATPVGIALAAHRGAAMGFTYVTVDGRGVRLFHPSRLRVADALLAAGYRMHDLRPRLAPGLTVTVNGALRLIPGTPGRPAVVRQGNGEAAGLDEPVRHGDSLTVVPAVPGRSPTVRVREVLHPESFVAITVDGDACRLPPVVRVNGQPAALDDVLSDNDAIDWRHPTVGEAMSALGLGDQHGPGAARPVRVQVNGAVVEFKASRRLVRNGCPVTSADPLLPGDRLQLDAVEPSGGPLFAHALERVGFATAPPPGKRRLVLSINGEPAQFVTPLRDGDRVVAAWE